MQQSFIQCVASVKRLDSENGWSFTSTLPYVFTVCRGTNLLYHYFRSRSLRQDCFFPHIFCYFQPRVIKTALSEGWPIVPVFWCLYFPLFWGTRLRSWLRYCATSRKVAGSIPADSSGWAVLRRGSAADRLLGLRVRIPSGAWMSVFCCRGISDMSTQDVKVHSG
jgi:hypothetical protein